MIGELAIFGLVALVLIAGVAWMKSAKPDHIRADQGQQEEYRRSYGVCTPDRSCTMTAGHISMAEEDAYRRVRENPSTITAVAQERSKRGSEWQLQENINHFEAQHRQEWEPVVEVDWRDADNWR